MTETFRNVYDDVDRARAYADLEFPGTYYLAFRDLPELLRRHVCGTRALDFGCGTGRSTRFLQNLGFEVVGVDVSEIMLDQARGRDPHGDYRLVADGRLAEFGTGTLDLILAAFTFDNIPNQAKASALHELRRLLAVDGHLVLVVSSPAIYWHEWASFSTQDYPDNSRARDGDSVRIVMLDVPDRRPVVDILCSDAGYRELFAAVDLCVLDAVRPLGSSTDAVQWVSETRIPPWTLYVLGAATGDNGRE
ncbi:MAG TPA: methyltransferase domain-containing protein [Steroidobacteraceae bacterium]|nr:methyltransferase domain-containing protein [Steroidobacteraceae bacterium]